MNLLDYSAKQLNIPPKDSLWGQFPWNRSIVTNPGLSSACCLWDNHESSCSFGQNCSWTYKWAAVDWSGIHLHLRTSPFKSHLTQCPNGHLTPAQTPRCMCWHKHYLCFFCVVFLSGIFPFFKLPQHVALVPASFCRNVTQPGMFLWKKY